MRLLEGYELAAEFGLSDGEGLGSFGPASDAAELEEIGAGFVSRSSAGGSEDLADLEGGVARFKDD